MKEEPTICVVDGDPAVRNRMTSLFKSAAINSCCYKSPVRLLNALQPDHPGCIVLELRLPGMNGLDLQAALRDKHY